MYPLIKFIIQKLNLLFKIKFIIQNYYFLLELIYDKNYTYILLWIPNLYRVLCFTI